MVVDGSYTPWVRPTRRVHFALSLGMTLTGMILIMAGSAGSHGAPGGSGDRSAAGTSPLIGHAADSVGGGDRGAPPNFIPAAPLVNFAPPFVRIAPQPLTPPKPKTSDKTHAKPHAKPHPHSHHPAPTPAQAPAPALAPTPAPAPTLTPTPAPTPAPAPAPASPSDLSHPHLHHIAPAPPRSPASPRPPARPAAHKHKR